MGKIRNGMNEIEGRNHVGWFDGNEFCMQHVTNWGVRDSLANRSGCSIKSILVSEIDFYSENKRNFENDWRIATSWNAEPIDRATPYERLRKQLEEKKILPSLSGPIIYSKMTTTTMTKRMNAEKKNNNRVLNVWLPLTKGSNDCVRPSFSATMKQNVEENRQDPRVKQPKQDIATGKCEKANGKSVVSFASTKRMSERTSKWACEEASKRAALPFVCHSRCAKLRDVKTIILWNYHSERSAPPMTISLAAFIQKKIIIFAIFLPFAQLGPIPFTSSDHPSSHKISSVCKEIQD